MTPHALAGSLSWSRQYAYDPSGYITNIDNQQFVYDSLGRLTEMATNGTSTESYVYDRYGNQTSRTTSSGTQAMDVTAATNRLSSGYGYDPAGNVINGDSYTFSYDALGQAATKSYASTTTFNETYVYSASEERIGMQTSNSAESSSWWYWSVRDEGGKVLRQYKTSANDPTQPALWIEDYVWRDGLLLGAERPAILGGRRHFHLDHLGSPRLITSDAGQIVSSHDYLPFGGESSSVYQETGDGFDREDPMKFTGHERDYAGGFGREDGHAIDYMHARYYSAGLGRFLAADPLLGDPSAPQTWNRYSYALNNPIVIADPRGLEPCKVTLTGSDAKIAGVADGTEVDGTCVEAEAPKDEPPPPDPPANFSWDLHPSGSNLPDGMRIDRLATLKYQAAHGDEFAMMLLGYPAESFGIEPTYDEFWLITGVASLVKGIGAVGAKVFTPNQQALIALAKELRRVGASPEAAKIMLQWAKEYGIDALDHTAGQDATHWVGGPHIRIGPINHIPVH